MAVTSSQQIVQKLWNYCNVLRDDGLSYQDYVEQLTFLLFLKMSHEQEDLGRPSPVPKKYAWPTLLNKSGDDLEVQYRHVLDSLGKEPGTLGLIFRKATNKIQDPAKLERLVKELIGKEQWMSLDADVKGDAYEGLLEKNAQDTKGGAGQYFTPRPLIRAIVACIAPKPGETVCDPACGTGGFLLAAHEHILAKHAKRMDKDQLKELKLKTLHGVEIVDQVTRMCAMNLMLHGVGPTANEDADPPVRTDDSLKDAGNKRFDVVLTNPPFGKKSSVLVVGEDGENERQAISIRREDFWATTSNKQLNFVQHVFSILKENGRAAVVVPDNVLFEGGAGETIRRRLLAQADMHTVLRLPTGLFYAQGVKANVIFFEKKKGQEKPWTERVWFYDLRTNMHFTLKTKPLQREDLDEFVKLYNPKNRHDRKPTWSEESRKGRWRAYTYDEILARDKVSLDITWLKDESLEDSANLPEPEVLAEEIIEDLKAATAQFEAILADLRK
jgi:type I restriction enzyme M protein